MYSDEHARNATLSVIDDVADKGAKLFGCEPIGFVLLYPDAAFLKVVWKDAVDSREYTSKALMDASLDEMSKMEGVFRNE